MKKIQLVCSLIFLFQYSNGQNITQLLDTSFKKFLNDSANKHASISFYVVNSKTNEVVYNYNNQQGLIPGSCQKIITSIASLELLGSDFQYKTDLGYNGSIQNNVLKGNLFIKGYGDPTLGSWRYSSTKDSLVFRSITEALAQQNIHKIDGNIILDNSAFSLQPLPNAWLWEDMGNYYGAGCWALNWFENQFSIQLNAGKNEGDPTTISRMNPAIEMMGLSNHVTTGKKLSPEDATIYLAPYTMNGFITGSIPLGEKPVNIAGANPNPAYLIESLLAKTLKENHIGYKAIKNTIDAKAANDTLGKPTTVFYQYLSPCMDSITYWFLRKSVNLYGEAFLKAMAYAKTGEGATDKGIKIISNFWKERGIEKGALRMYDGCGLSPQNKLTTHSLVTALQYARGKDWFHIFYNALPELNGMKIKSGTIGGVKGFAGYHTSKSGTNYTIAFIVNNFEGSSAAITKKLYEVLDVLK